MIHRSVFLAFLSLTLSACDNQAPDLATILDHHAEARGGAEAIASIRAIEIELTLTEPDFTVEGLYRATRDGRMRVDIFVGGERVFTEAYDGRKGWQMFQGEEVGVDMTAEGEEVLKRGILGNVFGLNELPGLGLTLRLNDPEEFDGKRYWPIDVIHKDGFRQRYYLDAKTYLVAANMEDSALHPDLDPGIKRFKTFALDYRPVEGVLFSFGSRKIDLGSSDIVQTTETTVFRVNPDIDPEIFRRPE